MFSLLCIQSAETLPLPSAVPPGPVRNMTVTYSDVDVGMVKLSIQWSVPEATYTKRALTYDVFVQTSSNLSESLKHPQEYIYRDVQVGHLQDPRCVQSYSN